MTLGFRDRLAAGPSLGVGATNQIVDEVLHGKGSAIDLVDALSDTRPVVVIRAANAIKKVQAAEPELVALHARKILKAAMNCEELLARWSLTVVVGRLPLKGRDRALAIELMFEALSSESSFLRTFAMQALVDLAADDAALRQRVRPIVEQFAEHGTAAMRARARKLLPIVSR